MSIVKDISNKQLLIYLQESLSAAKKCQQTLEQSVTTTRSEGNATVDFAWGLQHADCAKNHRFVNIRISNH